MKPEGEEKVQSRSSWQSFYSINLGPLRLIKKGHHEGFMMTFTRREIC
ncbi:MAG: hypothetical protein Q8934_01760 [Bacillota bacterium]|nr:hypothetical protein [Bacillota bacterium]